MSLLRRLYTRLLAAFTANIAATPTVRNSAETKRKLERLAQLQRLTMTNYRFTTGFDLMPRKLPNQRQRRKRLRQAGT